MGYLLDQPVLVFIISFIGFALSAWLGNSLLSHSLNKDSDNSVDLGLIQTATLTLLALIIGFTFSMAIDRHDNREILEEGEANAIGTEYLRVDLLPSDASARTKDLLNQYLDQRILFYSKPSKEHNQKNVRQTDDLQNALWNEVLPVARTQPTPTIALVVSGMNDVLNAQGYVQAAWWNRIPHAAWILMAVIALCANVLVGFGAHNFKKNVGLFMIFPFVTSISFFLIADIDSPKGGVIRIEARNLITLKNALNPQTKIQGSSQSGN